MGTSRISDTLSRVTPNDPFRASRVRRRRGRGWGRGGGRGGTGLGCRRSPSLALLIPTIPARPPGALFLRHQCSRANLFVLPNHLQTKLSPLIPVIRKSLPSKCLWDFWHVWASSIGHGGVLFQEYCFNREDSLSFSHTEFSTKLAQLCEMLSKHFAWASINKLLPKTCMVGMNQTISGKLGILKPLGVSFSSTFTYFQELSGRDFS